MKTGMPNDDSVSSDESAPSRADRSAGLAETWVDPDAIDRLIEDTSNDLLPQMARIFVEELREQVAMMTSAVEESDIALLERESHVMKSSAAIFGLHRVRASAERLNLACRGDDPLDVVKLVDALLEDISPSISALQQRAGISDETTG